MPPRALVLAVLSRLDAAHATDDAYADALRTLDRLASRPQATPTRDARPWYADVPRDDRTPRPFLA